MLLWLKEIVFEAWQTQYERKLFENLMIYSAAVCFYCACGEEAKRKYRIVNRISGLPD